MKVDLAGLQRRDGGELIHVVPDDAVEAHDLAAGRPGRSLLAGPVGRVAVIDVGRAVPRLVLIEQERARADRGRDLLVRVRLGFLPAHDVADVGRGLGQHLDQELVGLAQDDLEGPLVPHRRVEDAQEEMLPAAVAGRPAPHGGDTVGRGDGRAVREGEALAQPEAVGLAVLGHRHAGQHLRPRPHLGVHAEESVVDHGAVVDRDHSRGPNRVERSQIPVHHGAQCARGRDRGPRADDRRRGGERACREPASDDGATCRCHGVLRARRPSRLRHRLKAGCKVR